MEELAFLLHSAPRQLHRHKEEHHHEQRRLLMGLGYVGGPLGSAAGEEGGGRRGGGGGSGAEQKSENAFAALICFESRMNRRRDVQTETRSDRMRVVPLEGGAWNRELSQRHKQESAVMLTMLTARSPLTGPRKESFLVAP